MLEMCSTQSDIPISPQMPILASHHSQHKRCMHSTNLCDRFYSRILPGVPPNWPALSVISNCHGIVSKHNAHRCKTPLSRNREIFYRSIHTKKIPAIFGGIQTHNFQHLMQMSNLETMQPQHGIDESKLTTLWHIKARLSMLEIQYRQIFLGYSNFF